MLKGWDPLLAIVVGTAYTLGIVCDRFLGNVSVLVQDQEWIEPLLGRKDLPDHKPSEFDEFYTKDIFLPHAFEALENTNRQIHLLRATTVNSFTTSFVLLIWYRSYADLWFVDVLLLAIGFVSAWNWYMSRRMYSRSLKRCYDVAQKKVAQNVMTEGARLADPDRGDASPKEN